MDLAPDGKGGGLIALSPADVGSLAVAPPPPPPPLPPDEVVGPIGEKPTEASTGPRGPLTDVAVPKDGLVLGAGTYQGKNFKGFVTARPGAKLTDCASWGLRSGMGVEADHCDILGWFGVLTDNLDPALPGFTGRFCRVSGPKDNDAIRIGAASVFGDNTRYVNTLLEDSLLVSGFSGKPLAHFDLVQFGGGHNSMFRRVAFLYTTPTWIADEANAYVNNGTKNLGVELEDCWIDGGPVASVLSGPMKVTRTIIARSCKHFNWVSGASVATRPVLVNVYDDAGTPILSPA